VDSIIARYIFFMGLFMVWMVFDLLQLAWGNVNLVQFLVIFGLGVFTILVAAWASSRLPPLEVPDDE
jgi:NADH:ubiquinone oxidoreductase subunit H